MQAVSPGVDNISEAKKSHRFRASPGAQCYRQLLNIFMFMRDCTMNRLFPAALTCQDKLSPETRGQHMWQPIGIGAVALATYDHPQLCGTEQSI